MLGLDLNCVIPFAAVPENGCEIIGLDDKSELVDRIKLVNLLRLLGAIKTKIVSHQIVTCSMQVVLPLSPIMGCLVTMGFAARLLHVVELFYAPLVLRIVPPSGRGGAGAGVAHTLVLGVRGRAHRTRVCGRGMRRGWWQGKPPHTHVRGKSEGVVCTFGCLL